VNAISENDADERSEGWSEWASDQCLQVASYIVEPPCWAAYLGYRLVAPLEGFDNCESKVQEIAFRSLTVLGGLVAAYLAYAYLLPVLSTIIAMGSASKLLKTAGYALRQENFTYKKGSLPETSLPKNTTIMTWNVAGIAGGMHYDHAGVISWKGRFDKIISEVERNNPDILVFNEIYDPLLASALYNHLTRRFSHVGTEMGANVLGVNGGLMVLMKCAGTISNTDFSNNPWTITRGFACLEVKRNPQDQAPCLRIYGTHPHYGDTEADKQRRNAQLGQILEDNQKRNSERPLPMIIAGDLNIPKEEFSSALPGGCKEFEHSYKGEDETCSNMGLKAWSTNNQYLHDGRTIDYISLYNDEHKGGVQLTNGHLGKAYETGNFDTRTASSDHQPVIAEIILP